MSQSLVVRTGAVLDRDHVAGLLEQLASAMAGGSARVVLDLGAVERFDSAGLGTVLEGLERARAAGVEVRLKGLTQPMLDFFSLLSVDRLLREPARDGPRLDPISRLGGLAMPLLRMLKAVWCVMVRALRGLFVDPLRGRGLRIDRAIEEVDHAALGALPIVALIAFLLGLILSMQAWVQLRVWGAELYIADMVGVAVMTEIGPLMTAIVLAARSGSANAAQLGSMVVGEEIDALEQMGIDSDRFLVVPKVLALMLSAITLGVVFDAVADLRRRAVRVGGRGRAAGRVPPSAPDARCTSGT